jgi:YfiH family protein
MSGSALWVWQQAERWRWLECQLLAEWPHAFGSRQGHPHPPSQLAARLQLPPEQAAWGHQVHGCNWVWADGITETFGHKREQDCSAGQGIPTRSQADAVIARRQGDSAWVCTADCVPILVASREWVAAIHAGWRGTAAGILSKVLQEFLRAGIPAAGIRVAIGPSISGSVYQGVRGGGGAGAAKPTPRAGCPRRSLARSSAWQGSPGSALGQRCPSPSQRDPP